MTRRIHSDEAFEAAMQVSELLFNPKVNIDFLKSLTTDQFDTISGELPSFSISKSVLEGAVIVDVLAEHVSICASKSEAKKPYKTRPSASINLK